MGTDYVPRTGLALVHQGERITPAGENASGGGQAITVEIVNNGTPQRVVSATPQMDPRGLVIRIVAEDIASGQGEVSTALRARYGLNLAAGTNR
jgi:hypothetical protein